MRNDVRFFVYDISNELQAFILPKDWCDKWDEYVASLNLDTKEFPTRSEFDVFLARHKESLKIVKENDRENRLILCPIKD